MGRSISWIREIWNKTSKPYTIWCWDTDNEGLYIDANTHAQIGVNDGGHPVTIKAGEHVVTSGGSCGIPDGGDKEGFPKRRVFFAGVPDRNFKNSVGPRRGLRLNRTKLDDHTEQILYMDEATGRFVGRMTFPAGTEQTLNVVINPAGFHLNIVESATSAEAKFYIYAVKLAKWEATQFAELAKEAAKAAITAK